MLGELTRFARALSGRLLIPEFAAYGYYPIEDRRSRTGASGISTAKVAT